MIRRTLQFSLLVTCAILCHACTQTPTSTTTEPATTTRPNVVIIYGDDVGFGDLSCYGATKIPTPHLDQLASEGLKLTDGHCTASTCTPSRFSLLTGIHGFRYNARVLPPNAPLIIPTNIDTLPKMMRRAGYHTAVIGKWHLGLGERNVKVDWNADVKPGPLEIGFDYSFLLPSTNDRVPCVYLENHRVVNLDPQDPLYIGKKPQDPRSTIYPDGRTNREAMTYYQSSHGHNSSVINGVGRMGYMSGGKSALWNDETMADEFIKQTERFLDTHIAQRGEQPFFLYFASQDIHVPRMPHPRFHGKSELGYRGDAMVQLDWSAGAIMKMLKERGLDENTLVIFSSDNGPVYDDGYVDGTTVLTSTKDVDRGHDGSGPWRGGKYQIAEGGTRVPLIVRWPAQIKQGQVSDALFSQIDLLASLAELTGTELAADQAIDSRNMLSTLIGKDQTGLDHMIEESGATLALRQGNWKYVRNQKGAENLYNLSSDPLEKTNVMDQNPEKAKYLRELLSQYAAENGRLRP